MTLHDFYWMGAGAVLMMLLSASVLVGWLYWVAHGESDVNGEKERDAGIWRRQ